MRDLIAGVVVGIVALPLALAFAIASGVPPERGLYTAVIAGFLISALGGSRVQIGGPTGAFVVIVYGIVAKYGYDGLVIFTMMAGVILVILGLARMGALIKFIPYPVITGFTSGIAVIIFSSQVKDFLGLKMGAVPADFMDKWMAYGEHFRSINVPTTLVAARHADHPRRLAADLAHGSGAVRGHDAGDGGGAALSSAGGDDRHAIRRRSVVAAAPHWPAIPWTHMKEFFSPALTVALLAAIESLLSAVVLIGMALLVPERIHGRIQGFVTLGVSVSVLSPPSSRSWRRSER